MSATYLAAQAALDAAESVLSVHVVGTPKPQGSKRAFVVPGKGDRKARAVVVDSDKGPLKDWRGDVTAAVRDAYGADRAPTLGPLAVRLVFALPRPASSRAAVLWPFGRVGDVDKLARSVLDSLEAAGVMKDDAQVCDLRVVKRYPGPDIGQHVPGVRITVHRLNPEGTHLP